VCAGGSPRSSRSFISKAPVSTVETLVPVGIR
jgi:hypothetical protein